MVLELIKGLYLYLYLALVSSAKGADIPSPIHQYGESSSSSQPRAPQTSYWCNAFNDYQALPQGGLNGTKCDCGAANFLATVAPTVQPNVTDFADPEHCSDYVLISARGTMESQGLSSAFGVMTLETLRQVPNGAVYAVQYPAGIDQNTTQGSRDVVNSITRGLEACPNRTYVLYGVSQGATVILRALPEFTDEMFNSVKAVILAGSLYRTPGKRSNVDSMGIHTPKNEKATGVGVGTPDATELPEKWDRSGKVLDICMDGDGICDSLKACSGLTMGHFSYGFSQSVQTVGTKHVVERLLG